MNKFLKDLVQLLPVIVALVPNFIDERLVDLFKLYSYVNIIKVQLTLEQPLFASHISYNR